MRKTKGETEKMTNDGMSCWMMSDEKKVASCDIKILKVFSLIIYCAWTIAG